ncbi:hypothetical protein B9479_005508 [Cryptococcus floricola]|uniref:Uncharacterized protein n=1 Tax=Cryptococcus floricola TaxID=2591691 RepID=A0A5D3ASL8_9TREE|nr:hypothetical protein B9479_005508 [Cryptococcus floricola]
MADDNEHESSSSCPVGADDAGGFTFYNPSTQDFASVPVSMPDFVSAARLAYGTEGDDDIVWPYDPRQPGPTWDPLPIRAMLDSLPEVQDWLENVPRVPINEEAAFQLLSLRRETPFDDFTLSYAETVEHLYHNDRAQIAFWAFNRGVLGDSVPDTVQRSGVESTLNWFDSARDLIEENGSIAKPT